VAVQGGPQVDHLFQARLSTRVYEWLRTQWYERRVSMNSVVAATVADVRNGRLHLDDQVLSESDDDPAPQRFTVRLPGVDYEWLRAEAFRRHVSINRLLVLALEGHMAMSEQGAGRPDHEDHEAT